MNAQLDTQFTEGLSLQPEASLRAQFTESVARYSLASLLAQFTECVALVPPVAQLDAAFAEALMPTPAPVPVAPLPMAGGVGVFGAGGAMQDAADFIYQHNLEHRALAAAFFSVLRIQVMPLIAQDFDPDPLGSTWWQDHAQQHRAFDAALGITVGDLMLGSFGSSPWEDPVARDDWLLRHGLRHMLYATILSGNGV